MPWHNSSYFAFNSESISQSSPSAPGVYAILNSQRYICVGRSADLRQTLLSQLNGSAGCVLNCKPAMFRHEGCTEVQAKNRCNSRIMDFGPFCSDRLYQPHCAM